MSLELAPEQLTADGRIEDLHVDALLVHVLRAGSAALKPALRARSKRCMPRISAARNSGVENGYLPSAVSDSPSTAIAGRASIRSGAAPVP